MTSIAHNPSNPLTTINGINQNCKINFNGLKPRFFCCIWMLHKHYYYNYVFCSVLEYLMTKEVNKTLRTVWCCNQLLPNSPSAHEVINIHSSTWDIHFYHLQVCERLFVGNGQAATSIPYLSSLGITHLLNAAHPGECFAIFIFMSFM